ncbi:MAG: extracellular solute-binding protein [Actinobacteria bacterium]|nr:extracellular solute-binding protein [Actinomycetota bacterium]
MDSNSVSRRKFIGVAGGVAAGAAIGGPASAATKKPVAKPKATKAPVKAPAAAPVAVNKPGTGVVNYWNHFTAAAERAGFEAVTNGFKKASPNIDLKVETIQNPDWMTKYINAVMSKSGPDALMVTQARLADMSRIGGLATVNNALSLNGSQYALPVFAFIDWGYYRPDFFAAKGIKKVPTTLEEFRLAAIELTNPDKKIYGFGLRGGAGGGGFVTKLLHAFNGPIYDPKTRKATLELDAAVDALRFWVRLGTKDKCIPPTAAGDGYAQFMGSFKAGGTAMILHHTGSYVEITTPLKAEIEVKTFNFPKGPKAEMTNVSPLGNGLFKGTTNPDAGFEWITYWASKKAQVDFLQATGYWPTATGASADPFIKNTPAFRTAENALKIGWTSYTFPGVENWEINTILPNVQKALNETITPEQAARNIWTELRDITDTK